MLCGWGGVCATMISVGRKGGETKGVGNSGNIFRMEYVFLLNV